MKNKTLFQEKFWNKTWLSTILEKNSKWKISAQTIRNALNWKKVNESSIFEIYVWLIELKYIKYWEYTKNELFDNR